VVKKMMLTEKDRKLKIRTIETFIFGSLLNLGVNSQKSVFVWNTKKKPDSLEYVG
jgi:hypothetical protein